MNEVKIILIRVLLCSWLAVLLYFISCSWAVFLLIGVSQAASDDEVNLFLVGVAWKRCNSKVECPAHLSYGRPLSCS
jgi:hypothetical protein